MYNADRYFDMYYKWQKNFMTPELVACGYIGKNKVYELSKGRGISEGSWIYGVTILQIQPAIKPKYDLNKCFSTPEEAEQYIKSLTH